jgi:hypothetical protein
MKEPVISNLDNVTKRMIDDLEIWLENINNGIWKAGKICPFQTMYETGTKCENLCMILFDNDHDTPAYCPCCDYNFGQKATILAFQIICDIWKGYHK